MLRETASAQRGTLVGTSQGSRGVLDADLLISAPPTPRMPILENTNNL